MHEIMMECRRLHGKGHQSTLALRYVSTKHNAVFVSVEKPTDDRAIVAV